jgi:hypothetical protein
MRVSLLSLCIFTLSFCSCSDNKKSDINFKVVNDSLTLSNEKFKNANDSIFKILVQKLQDEKLSQIAILWEPKADLLKYQSENICMYLDTLISKLDNSNQFIDADSLYLKLDSYKGFILRIDPEMSNNIKYSADIITLYFDSARMSNNDRLDIDFSRMPKDEQMFILKRAKNNIEIIENKAMIFCNNKVE